MTRHSTRTRLTAAALALASLVAVSAPALAQLQPPRSQDAPTGSVTGGPAPRSGLEYETDGNSKSPRALESSATPAYQRGSGQETGGPARELIPR